MHLCIPYCGTDESVPYSVGMKILRNEENL